MPDLVISDIRMSAGSGLDMLRRIRENQLNVLFVLISGYDDFSYVQEAFRYQAFFYLLKPLEDLKSQRLILRIRGELMQRDSQSSKTYRNDSLGKAMQYIDEHLDSSFTLDEMAKALYINKNYLSSTFTKQLGQTFTQYKNTQRIALAAKMIREGEPRLLDVAQQTGFDSPSHFCKVFKRVLGVTPQEYKSNHGNTMP